MDMRELIIKEYVRLLEYENKYWAGWGDKTHMIKELPIFADMDNEKLLEDFLTLVRHSSQPRV